MHSRQTLTPSSDEYLPLVQSRQTLTPIADEYLPLSHGTQSVSASLPSIAEYLPLVQSRQTPTPSSDEYLPITHRRHALTPVSSEYFPTAQSMQMLAEEAPTVAEYLLTTQLVQDVPASRLVEYLSVGQSWHALTPMAVPQGQSFLKEELQVDSPHVSWHALTPIA